MKRRQFTSPLLMRGGKALPLTPMLHERNSHSEDQLQTLLFDHPSLIPIEEIEPGFGDLIPVSRELGTERGPLDLLFIDNRGHLVLVETKLWRNPGARRQVVGQLVDYASDMATWSYSKLIERVKDATDSKDDDPLITLAREYDPSEFNESRFIDAVTRNLAYGRFLLLIVGDGIHEGVEQMAEFLQNQPHLGFHLSLIEMQLFKAGSETDDVFVQPRIIAHTREIPRATIEVRIPVQPGDVVVKPVRQTPGTEPKSESLTQKEYFEALAAVSRELPDLVAATLTEAPRHSLFVEWRTNGPILKYRFADDADFLNLGQLAPDGTLSSSWLSAKCNRLDLPADIWRRYYSAVLLLLEPGTEIVEFRKRSGDEGVHFVDKRGGDPSFLPLLRNRDKWFQAIEKLIDDLESTLKASPIR